MDFQNVFELWRCEMMQKVCIRGVYFGLEAIENARRLCSYEISSIMLQYVHFGPQASQRCLSVC